MSKGSKESSSKTPQAPRPQDRQPATLRHVDLPDLAETFADSINALYFDGQTLRIELGITRFDNVKPNEPMTGRRYPACRLILAPVAAVELINRLQQIAAALTQAGILKQAQQAKQAQETKQGKTF
jgi:hypothetical protein